MQHFKNVFANSVYLFCTLFFLNKCSSPEDAALKNNAPSAVDTVVIQQMKFNPSTLYLNKGDSVIFINNDLVAHDVTEKKNKNWSSDTLAIGKSWKMEVLDSDVYYCTIHPGMEGKLLLK